MSRKTVRPGVGRIEFTGLRFFLRVTGGRVSRKELVELVRGFFASRGLYVETLRVEFRRTRRPTSVIDGEIRSVWGLMYPGQNRVEIFVATADNPMTPSGAMGTVGHELDHEAWELEGKEFDDSLLYGDRPHEIRAGKTGAAWCRRFVARV